MLNMTKRFLSVARQNYKMDVHPEYVMLGNDVLLKCSFPSFVADFVAVLSWIDSEASEYSLGTNHEGNSARKRVIRTFYQYCATPEAQPTFNCGFSSCSLDLRKLLVV